MLPGESEAQRQGMPAEQRAAQHKGTAPYAKPHACPRCAAAFTRAGSLKTHERTVHEKRRDHVCPHCAATFGMAGSLKIHVRRKHASYEEFT